MVDPFPGEPSTFEQSSQLSTVIGNTINALKRQVKVKPTTIKEALDNNNASQFLIAPVRYLNSNNKSKKTKIEGSKALACGALGGFGGFIEKEFRIHDFFLGRANCERFLREHFTLPEDHSNEIFKEGYARMSD